MIFVQLLLILEILKDSHLMTNWWPATKCLSNFKNSEQKKYGVFFQKRNILKETKTKNEFGVANLSL